MLALAVFTAIAVAVGAGPIRKAEDVKMSFYENIAKTAEFQGSPDFFEAVVMMFDWATCSEEIRDKITDEIKKRALSEQRKQRMIRHIWNIYR